MKWRMVFWKVGEGNKVYPLGYIFDPRAEAPVDLKKDPLYKSYDSLDEIESVAANYSKTRTDWRPMIIEDDS